MSATKKRAASPPVTTRWSKVSDNGSRRLTAGWPRWADHPCARKDRSKIAAARTCHPRRVPSAAAWVRRVVRSARWIDLDQAPWLSADVRCLFCPICQLAWRSRIELLVAADGKANGLEPGEGCAGAAAIQGSPPCIHATVFQSEIFGNRKMERGRIAAARALDRAKAASGGAWRNDP